MINPTHQLVGSSCPPVWSGAGFLSNSATLLLLSLPDPVVRNFQTQQYHRVKVSDQKTVALLVVCSFPSLNTEEAHAFLLTLAECATQKHFIPAAAVVTSPRLGGGFAVETKHHF